MEWLELKIDTSHAGLDAVTDMLEQQGVTGVRSTTRRTFRAFWRTTANTGIMWMTTCWRRRRVSAA